MPPFAWTSIRQLRNYMRILGNEGKDQEDLSIYTKDEFKAYKKKALGQHTTAKPINPTVTVTVEEKAKNGLQSYQRNKRQEVKSHPQIKHDYEF